MTRDDGRSLAAAQAAALLAIGIWLAVAPRRAARRPPLSVVASPTMTTLPSLRESEWFRGAGGEPAAGSRAEEGNGRLSGSRSGPSTDVFGLPTRTREGSCSAVLRRTPPCPLSS